MLAVHNTRFLLDGTIPVCFTSDSLRAANKAVVEGYSSWVCLSVCVSVKSHLTYAVSVRPETAVTYSAGNKGQKICGDLPEMTVFKSYAVKHERKSQYINYSDLPAVSFLRLTYSEAPEGTQRLSTTLSLAQNYGY